jgi:glutaredoxin-related protein
VAVDNVHASDLAVKNASEDAAVLEQLRQASGAETAPCLLIDGKTVSESDVIVRTLAERLAPVR